MALPTVNVLSICSGVGGLELGLQLAHHHRGQAVRGVCYLERETAAVASLVASMEAGWFHPAPIWSDARTFDGAAWRGCVDIVTSGDPCQGNSVAGKRLGQLDDRWLLDRAIEIFDESGASTFWRENVPGNADGQLAVAIPALERLGCRIAVGIFSSAETGNTMRRERLFILAKRADVGHERGGRAWGWGDGLSDCGEQLGGSIGCSDGRVTKNEGRQPIGRIAVDGTSGGSVELACTAMQRCGEEGADCARPEERIGGTRREFGGTSSAGPQGQQRGQHVSTGREVKGRPVGLSGRTVLPPAVIPGPTDNSGWIDVLDRYPEYQPALSQEEAESHLRRGIDAMANRVERLRATGNGVDPVAAAYAFISLDALIERGASSRSSRNVLLKEAA